MENKVFDTVKYYDNASSIQGYFIKYIYNKMGYEWVLQNISNDVYSFIGVDTILSSLKKYIGENGIHSQSRANRYITEINKLFNILSSDYGINNNIFTNSDTHKYFMAKAKEIILQLKVSPISIATQEEINAIDNEISNFLNYNYHYEHRCNLNEVILSETWDSDMSTQKSHYNRFMSIIAIKFIEQFGFKDKILYNLKVDDIDAIKKTCNINKVSFTIYNRTANLLLPYLKARKSALKCNNKTSDKFFVDRNGNDFLNPYGQVNLFLILKDCLKSVNDKRIAYKTIIRMIKEDIPLDKIKNITGYSKSTIEKLHLIERENEEILEQRLIESLKNDLLADIDIPPNEPEEKTYKRVKRYKKIIDDLKESNNYHCQLCEANGNMVHTFTMESGHNYCEAHHLKTLAKGGPQSPENVLIVCANHHRMFHYAKEGYVSINDGILTIGDKKYKLLIDNKIDVIKL